jgi:hypothetical protein
MRHIHADHMIAAANDTSIKWEQLSSAGIWIGDNAMYWWPEREYRQKPTQHPHQAMIDQEKDDPSIVWQLLTGPGCWSDCIPGWVESWQYRQKPAEPKMVYLWQWSFRSRVTGGIFASNEYHADKPVDSLFNSSAPVCRIEGSKITVPEVSQ